MSRKRSRSDFTAARNGTGEEGEGWAIVGGFASPRRDFAFPRKERDFHARRNHDATAR